MQMLWSAQAGLAAVLSRRQQMSGQMSATWSLVLVIPGVVSLLLGGALSDLLEKGAAETAARTFLLAGAALSAGIALFGVFKPATIFPSSAEPEPARGSLLTDVARLIRYKPIYPALLAYLLWVFTPGTGTPLQYYLTNTLHGSDSQWGQFLAILNLSMIPTFLLFGWLARRVALRRLLWWSVIVGAPGLIPMLFVHSAAGALALAVLFGLSCGLGNAAFLNLMIRVCPQGLEGTMMMMAASMVAIAARGGDVLGAAIYDRWHSFTPCVVAATLTTGAILLVLPFLSKDLVSETDGQAVPDSLAEPVAAPA
jgi:Na+/melibiose symporter-like transporter